MLSKEEVEKIAKLARLELRPDEFVLYQERLGKVLGYIKELEGVAVGKESFVKHVPADAGALREDKPDPFKNTAGLLKNAPTVDNHQFIVPTVVEQSE